MKRIVLLLVSLFVVFLSTGCGPSDAEKRAQQVAQAKDDALKLRQQLAQAKSGADAENVRQQIMKVLSDASLTVESIHFTEAELKDCPIVAGLRLVLQIVPFGAATCCGTAGRRPSSDPASPAGSGRWY